MLAGVREMQAIFRIGSVIPLRAPEGLKPGSAHKQVPDAEWSLSVLRFLSAVPPNFRVASSSQERLLVEVLN